MDILRTDVWSSAYSIENVLMEIAVTIADNGTRAKKMFEKIDDKKYFDDDAKNERYKQYLKEIPMLFFVRFLRFFVRFLSFKICLNTKKGRFSSHF